MKSGEGFGVGQNVTSGRNRQRCDCLEAVEAEGKDAAAAIKNGDRKIVVVKIDRILGRCQLAGEFCQGGLAAGGVGDDKVAAITENLKGR